MIARVALIRQIQRVLNDLDAQTVQSLWQFSLKKWKETIEFGHI